MIHLYCVVDRPKAALAAIGSEVPDGQLVRGRQVAAVARFIRTGDLPTEGPALVEHDRLLRRMMEVSTVVPFRYGTMLADACDAARELEGRSEMFERLLARLRGQAELAVRARAATAGTDGAGLHGATIGGSVTGRDYLRALGARSSLGPLDDLHRALAALATASRVEVDGSGSGSGAGRAGAVGTGGLVSMRAAYLVPAEGVDNFKRQLSAAAGGTAGIEGVSLTGPWPPYSFVGPGMLGESEQGRTATSVEFLTSGGSTGSKTEKLPLSSTSRHSSTEHGRRFRGRAFPEMSGAVHG